MNNGVIFVLRQDGREIARHSTRLACAIEAIERKLAVWRRRRNALLNGVTITEEIAGDDRERIA